MIMTLNICLYWTYVSDISSSSSSFLLFLPLALQPTVAFGLSNHALPFFSYLPPTLSIFSNPALEDLFLVPLSIFSWVFPLFSSLPVLEWRSFWALIFKYLCLITPQLKTVCLTRFWNRFYRGADKSLARPGRKQARNHVRDARNFQQNRDASCHQVSFTGRQGAEGNSRHSDRNINLFLSWSG